MLTRQKLENKLNKTEKICIITVVKLPSNAVEVLTNYQELEAKKDYLLNAYDENLQLKNMPDIKLLDCIVISENDLNSTSLREVL
jgi:hypothetical protein